MASMEGWLAKRGANFGWDWERHWVVLEGSALSLFEDEAKTESKGCVQLSRGASAVAFSHPEASGEGLRHRRDKPFGFAVSERAGKDAPMHYFDAGHQGAMKRWVAALNDAAAKAQEAAPVAGGGYPGARSSQEAATAAVKLQSAFRGSLVRKEHSEGHAPHRPEHIRRMKSLLRYQAEPGEVRSDLQAALEEYQGMAEKLVEDFKSRQDAPQAEAFIEQVCVENILEGCVFVGHIKTDLDSVAGAIAGAELWRGVAARSESELNGEIKHALKFAGLEAPPLFDDIPGAAKPGPDGKLLGVCLVDHNEEKQMVECLAKDKSRSKRIRGLLDHHCLSESFASEKAMYIDLRPWGSVSTIIAHAFIRNNRKIEKKIARILLAAILSDTLNLQSVTTTVADRMMVTLLAIFGEVDDPSELAGAMFRAKTQWIVNLGAYEMTRGDQKDFSCNGWKIGIAVLEVTDTTPVLDVADELLLELRILKVEKGKDSKTGKRDRRNELDFSYLFVVDVTRQCSKLLICGGRELALARAAFPEGKLMEAQPGIDPPGKKIEAGQTMMDVGKIVSRKAEFVPAFFEALGGGFTCHKQPMSQLPEHEAFKDSKDDAEVVEAIQHMKDTSYHDSVQVKRDYHRLSMALNKQATAMVGG